MRVTAFLLRIRGKVYQIFSTLTRLSHQRPLIFSLFTRLSTSTTSILQTSHVPRTLVLFCLTADKKTLETRLLCQMLAKRGRTDFESLPRTESCACKGPYLIDPACGLSCLEFFARRLFIYYICLQPQRSQEFT